MKLVRPSVKSDIWNMETVLTCGRGVNLNPHIWSQNLWLKWRLWKLPFKKSAAWILWPKAVTTNRDVIILHTNEKEIESVSGILWLNLEHTPIILNFFYKTLLNSLRRLHVNKQSNANNNRSCEWTERRLRNRFWNVNVLWGRKYIWHLCWIQA